MCVVVEFPSRWSAAVLESWHMLRIRNNRGKERLLLKAIYSVVVAEASKAVCFGGPSVGGGERGGGGLLELVLVLAAEEAKAAKADPPSWVVVAFAHLPRPCRPVSPKRQGCLVSLRK